MSDENDPSIVLGGPSGWDKIHFERALAEALMLMDVLQVLIDRGLVTREQVVQFTASNQAILRKQGMENGVSWLDGFTGRFSSE